MKKVFVVARWEYLERVKSKLFLVSLLLMPLIILSMGILPGILAGQEEERTKVIGIVDIRGDLAISVAGRMQREHLTDSGEPMYVVRPLAVGAGKSPDAARREADSLVLHDEIEGFGIIDHRTLNETSLEYRSKNVGDFHIPNRLEEAVRQELSEQKLVSLGLDPHLLDVVGPTLKVRSVKLSTSGEEQSGFLQAFISAYAFLMMLFFMILSSGQLLVRSVIEEKVNRIVELLVSSCSPTQLMAGKVLGLSGLGFTQMIVWGLAGLAVSGWMGAVPVQTEHILLFLLYFVLGYLLYAAIFIGIGSPVTTEQEAQLVTSYLIIILVIPLILTVPALQNSDASWISVLTYIPLLTPSMMVLRLSIETPTASEILVTTCIMLVSIWGAMVAAGRIFRVAILATGKRATLAEIIRWVRTG
jgi:ABC-2 type transport system permease protein